MPEENKGMLCGVKVLDFTLALSGPFVAWNLADWGADVYKVERLYYGDQARHWDPIVNGLSTLFVAYNKNKKSIEIDLSKDEGKQIIYDLAKECDIVLENFKSGSIDRLGLGYEKLKEINPKLVFLSLSGFGATGPLKPYPCYDAIAAARSGFASSSGKPDGAPVKAGNAICDTLAGTYALNAVLMAYIDAQITGEGTHIDLSMTDVAMETVAESLIDYSYDQDFQMRTGNHDRYFAPYGIFKAADGWVSIIVDSEERWAVFCKELELASIMDDDRFVNNAKRLENKEELIEIIENKTERLSRFSIEKKLLEAGVPASAMLTFIEAYTSDHTNSTDVLQMVNQNNIGMMRFYTNPLRFNDEVCSIRSGTPLLGEHTVEILEDIGYSEENIQELLKEDVIGESLI
ncbi:MAG TPA: CoA transferase [Clostridiaceae bacterium]|nr:CoA transferase [Clostridiaceae bacterium]